MEKEYKQFLSVWIEIGADFSLMSVALPSQELLGKPYRILHSSQHSLDGAIKRIKNWSKQYKLPVRIFMESTGIYHFPMYYKLRLAGFDAYILNPLVTHAAKDINVRNVHNDKFDARKIALLGLRPGLKTSVIPSNDVAAVKAILREYHVYLPSEKKLRQAFPQFLTVFSKVNGVTAMAVLHEYLTPEAMLTAGVDELSSFMKKAVTKGSISTRKKAELLVEAAQAAQHFGHGNSGVFCLIRHYIEMIHILDAQTKQLLGQVKALLKEQRDPQMAKQVQLLQTIPGVGFLSAVALVCEIGDFSAFKRPKQLFAYFGLDPAVKQSGNFTGTDLKLSKRESPYARCYIYLLAIQSDSLNVRGTPKNPVLRSFYLEKCKSKSKMTALGAVMHKVCNLIFAVLRDEKPFS